MKTLIHMKFLYLIFYFIFFTLNSHSKETHDGVEVFEFRVSEIQKIGTITITEAHLKAEKRWDGVNFDELPYSAEQAVTSAKEALKKWGCNPEYYFVTEFSLVRIYRSKELKEWYWKITLADASAPASAYPVLSIPVLFSGKVPTPSFVEIED